MRFTISYILLEPKAESDVPYIKEQVRRLGYLAMTNKEFRAGISNYLKYKTGIGTNVLLMTVLSFLVGLSISDRRSTPLFWKTSNISELSRQWEPRGANWFT